MLRCERVVNVYRLSHDRFEQGTAHIVNALAVSSCMGIFISLSQLLCYPLLSISKATG
jgi:hypothetical protein